MAVTGIQVIKTTRAETCDTQSCNSNKTIPFILSSSLFCFYTSIEEHFMSHSQMVSRVYNVYKYNVCKLYIIHYTPS